MNAENEDVSAHKLVDPHITRTAGGRFAPGRSPNPAGRTRKSAEAKAVEALARTSSAEALAVVLSLMRSGQERTKLAAALAVLERGIGKPGELVAGPVDVPPGATLADRAQAIADAAMSGAVSIAQASALLSCLASVAKVREVEELERRITALEAQKGNP